VADDEQGNLYVLDGKGLWQLGAEPSAGSTTTHVVNVGGNVSNALEGVSLYYTSQGTGYIMMSDQGKSVYHLYQREGAHAYVGSFRIVANNTIDGVSDTDGIDVTGVNLGPSFPAGMFVAQDNPNTVGTGNTTDRTNFKLVGWDAIAQSFSPSLTTDTTWNPRSSSVSVSTATSTATATATATNTATATATATSTATATATATSTATATATATSTATATATVMETATATALPTATIDELTSTPVVMPDVSTTPTTAPENTDTTLWLPLIQ
jgi:hypothetical protein